MFNKDFDPLKELEHLKVLAGNNHNCIGHLIEVYKHQACALEQITEHNKLVTDRLLLLENRIIQIEEILACLYKE